MILWILFMFLLVFMVGAAIYAIVQKDLLYAVIGTSVISLYAIGAVLYSSGP